MSPSFLSLADTNILNIEGRTVTFDDLVDSSNRVETALRFNKGGFGSSEIKKVEPYLEDDGATVVTITVSTGEKFSVLSGTKVLTSSNEWVEVSTIRKGDGVKSLTYNPAVRHPQLTPKVVTDVEIIQEAFVPIVSFNVSSDDNILISVDSRTQCCTLFPVSPKQLQAA